MKYHLGFNLIELMITLVIIGLLTSILLPSYNEYVLQSRRSQGIAMLMEVMQHQERFFTEQITYSSDLSALGLTVPVLSKNEHYIISASRCGSTAINRCVQLTATPQGIQAGDGNIMLNSLGERSPDNYWK